jgi:ABC-type multidrug transport system permease subunit
MSAFFLILVILFMYFINVGIMQTKCGSANGSVFQATLLPWLFMFGPMMIALQFFPEWKKPFSNTIGFVVARMAGGTQALLDLLKPGSDVKLHYVYNDPSLLLNQFTISNFYLLV